MDETSPTQGRVRWAINFEKWSPTEEVWQKAISMVPQEERARIMRFKRPTATGYVVGKDNPNAKSSLIGQLLLRKMAHVQLGIPHREIHLDRTKEGKPYLVNPSTKFPNFNFNVSHSGEFVAGGCEPQWVVGVDVMETQLRRAEPVSEFFRTMRSCFTVTEWRTIEGGGDDKANLRLFFIHWTLKESYIKAVGIGLGFELQRAEFTLSADKATAVIAVDGVHQTSWHFEIHSIEDHVSAVAYGPASHTIASYQNVLNVDNSLPRLPPARMEFVVLNFEEVVDGLESLLR